MRASKTAGAMIALALAAPLATTTHTVRPGDTLSEIAAAHGTTVSALAAANGVTNPHHILAGQVLQIGGGGGTAPASGGGAAVHIVARGETLSAIAARYGATVQSLVAANGLADPNHILAGARLTVPTGAGAAPPAAGGSFPARLLARPDRLAMVPTFDKWAAHYGVPDDLLKAMTYLESGWQNHVVSSTGAVGIGQLMPATVDFVSCCLIGADLDPSVPDHNIRMSARFLRYLLDENGGDPSLALASYYQGLRAVRERGVYSQTKAYVAGVLAFRDGYGWR